VSASMIGEEAAAGGGDARGLACHSSTPSSGHAGSTEQLSSSLMAAGRVQAERGGRAAFGATAEGGGVATE